MQPSLPAPRILKLAYLALALAIPAGSTSSAEAQLDEHSLFAFQKRGPQMDGVLEGDEAWSDTQAAVDFLVLGSEQAASHATEGRAVWDGDSLYFGITAKLPSGAAPEVGSSEPWGNDCVEIWLQDPADNAAWYQFIIDAKGQGACLLHGKAGGTQASVEFHAVTKRSVGGWTAEVQIPFASIGMPVPKNGLLTGFALHRADASASPPQLSSWARLSGFNQSSRFPRLVFSTDWEVSPELSYWSRQKGGQELLRRKQVSARQILAGSGKTETAYTLLHYDPITILAERRKRHARLTTSGLYGDTVYWSGYKDLQVVAPAFYDAAMGINRCMMDLSALDNDRLQLARAAGYASAWSQESKGLSELPTLLAELDALYAIYGSAFDADWNVAALGDIGTGITTLSEKIAGARKETAAALARLQGAVAAVAPWQMPNLRFGSGESSYDASGTPNRIHHSLYGAFPYQAPIRLFWTDWDAVNIDWTRAVPASTENGTFTFPEMQRHADFIQKIAPNAGLTYHMLFGSYYAMPFPSWLEARAAAVPDMLIESADGKRVTKRTAGTAPVPIYDGMNVNHPEVQSYARSSIKALAREFGPLTAYVVAGWEDNNILHLSDDPVANGYRTVGYNPTGRAAFREYLRSHHRSIDKLNARWKTNYASFEAIEPPADKWLQPAKKATGLTYEWEKFIRWNHLQYSRLLRDSYREASPKTPVMIDDSHFLADGNLYAVFREGVADIVSYHWTPSNEDAIWSMIDRLTVRFGKTAGYFENYFPMYTNRAQGDELKARAALSEFFWRLYVRGNRYVAWWLQPHTGSSEYAAAYGGGLFGLDFDQTISRWSMSILPVMFERGRAIEKALVETRPEPTRAAILQPDASVMNLAARTHRVATNLAPVTGAITLHNEFLAPGGFPVDFITEDMVLDGKASLDEFDTLIVINGFWMQPDLGTRLTAWVRNGGTLIAFGPCAMQDPWGQPLEPDASPFLSAFDGAKVTGNDIWSAKIPATTPSSSISAQPLGKGHVVFLREPLDAFLRTPEGRGKINDLLDQKIPRSAVSDSDQIKLATRVAPDGTRYLFPVNVSLDKPAKATIRLRGKFADALDLVVPGGFPVALQRVETGSTFTLELAPGDWTALRLIPSP